VPALARTAAPGARIEVLHIFNQVQEARIREVGLDDARLDQYCDQALAEMGEQLDNMLAEQGDDHMTRQVLTGYLPAKICAHAATIHADLIVLGRFGASGLEEWLLGSVSKDVASAADCDVLVCC
jgi:nucleotide-binding universal stress UspA family protein